MKRWTTGIAALVVSATLCLPAALAANVTRHESGQPSAENLALDPTVLGPLTGLIDTTGATPWPLTANLTGGFTGTMSLSVTYVGTVPYMFGTTVTPSGAVYVTRGRWFGNASYGYFYGRAVDPNTLDYFDFEGRWFPDGSVSGGWR